MVSLERWPKSGVQLMSHPNPKCLTLSLGAAGVTSPDCLRMLSGVGSAPWFSLNRTNFPRITFTPPMIKKQVNLGKGETKELKSTVLKFLTHDSWDHLLHLPGPFRDDKSGRSANQCDHWPPLLWLLWKRHHVLTGHHVISPCGGLSSVPILSTFWSCVTRLACLPTVSNLGLIPSSGLFLLPREAAVITLSAYRISFNSLPHPKPSCNVSRHSCKAAVPAVPSVWLSLPLLTRLSLQHHSLPTCRPFWIQPFLNASRVTQVPNMSNWHLDNWLQGQTNPPLLLSFLPPWKCFSGPPSYLLPPNALTQCSPVGWLGWGWITAVHT